MHPKTSMQYKSQIEELERQVGAKVKRSQGETGQVVPKIDSLKDFTWNNKTRAKLTKEMHSIHMNAHGELILMYVFSSTPY